MIKDAFRKLVAFLFTQVGVCALVIAYNIVGAYTFYALEGLSGDDTPEILAEEALNTSVSNMWNVTRTLNILDEESWRKSVMKTLDGYQGTLVPLIKHRGYRGVHPKVAWSPPACLMYSLSVYTTIGESIYLIYYLMYSLSVYTTIGELIYLIYII